VRMGWMLREATEQKPMNYLREYLKEYGIDKFETLLREKDSENTYIYLLRTDKQYILARVAIFINEFDVKCASVDVLRVSTHFAKQIARRILQRQVKLDELRKECDGRG